MNISINMASWSWPQWTIAGIIAFNLLMHAIMDGKARTGNYSAGVQLVSAVISVTILTFGGFFA